MKKVKLFLVFLFSYYFFSQSSTAQVSRGATGGEIYITVSISYIGSTGTWNWGLFHSYNHGQQLALQYSSTSNHFSVIGDPIPGIVYGCKGDTIWMSSDFGVTWNTYLTNIIDTFGLPVGGNYPGELFLEDNQFKIFSSSDYGHTLMQTYDSLTLLQLRDVGVQSGTVYALNYYWQSYDPSIRISHNHGHTFLIQQVDSVFLVVSRGAVNNELYIIRMEYDTTEYYHIYQSFDEGMTLIPRGTIPSSISWVVSFTGGRTPGEFYAVRSRFDGIGTHLCIDYSSDSAKTFSTSCYYLPDLVSTNDIYSNNNVKLSQNSPNPFYSGTSIKFQLIKEENTNLIIYDLNGHVIKQLINSKMLRSKHIVTWDGTNDQGILVSSGVYYYTLKIGNSFQETKKMIFIR